MSLGVPASTATPVGRFRIVAFWEGISYLLLLFVAMPLKYGFGIDMAVSIVGMAHGVLFLGVAGRLRRPPDRHWRGGNIGVVQNRLRMRPAGYTAASVWYKLRDLVRDSAYFFS